MEEFFKAVILGIVEGITEFLPISSTGHLILMNRFIDFTGDFANLFSIVIQLGAILSVVVYFWDRLYPFSREKSAQQRRDVWKIWEKTVLGVIPAVLLGGLFADFIEKKLFNPYIVAIALVIGGVFLIILERKGKNTRFDSVQSLTVGAVIGIGLFQTLAMIPGTSRSAATILGAMALGASRAVAAEFSFFLAIPTMIGASGYSLLKSGFSLSSQQWMVLAVGFVVAFLVAWAVIAIFMNYIRRKDFMPFAYYRIVLGAVVLLYFALAAQ